MADDRPTDTTRWEKTPEGLARGDMRGAFVKVSRPEVPPYRPPKRGKPWWKQPYEER